MPENLPTTLRIRNWTRWQSYRADRGQPPWIKVHRRLMRDPAWVELDDAQRGQLVAIWLLAADRDGNIPSDPALIAKICCMSNPPDLLLLMNQGFIEFDVTMASRWRQHDRPEAEAEAEADQKPLSSRESKSKPARRQDGAGKASRGRRWGDAEEVPGDWIRWAVSEGLTHANAEREGKQFADYWRAKTGANATKRDWPATWRTWVRRNLERRGNGNGQYRPDPITAAEQRADRAIRAREAAQDHDAPVATNGGDLRATPLARPRADDAGG